MKLGLKLGLTIIDTAEVYAAGHCEELVGKAVSEDRERAFVVTKVSPENLGYDGVLRSCEQSPAMQMAVQTSAPTARQAYLAVSSVSPSP